MSGKCYTMRADKQYTLDEVCTRFKKKIDERLGSELIADHSRSLGTSQLRLLTFECLYFRTGSYASLCVLLTENEREQTADIVGFGGGEGVWNISWGANQDFAKNAVKILGELGFTVLNNSKN